jgi:hypothetical protein
MPTLMALPPEIKDIIYSQLIKWDKRNIACAFLFSAHLNCYIPRHLLLISQAFSTELIYVFSRSLKLSVELSPIHCQLDMLFKGLPSMVVSSIRELFVHIKRTTSAESMLYWQYKCRILQETHISGQITFLLEELDLISMTKLDIKVDIAKADTTNDILRTICFASSIKEFDASLRRDKWNSVSYQELTAVVEKKQRSTNVKLKLCYQ